MPTNARNDRGGDTSVKTRCSAERRHSGDAGTATEAEVGAVAGMA